MNPAPDRTSNGWTELFITLAMQSMASMTLLTLPVVAPVVGSSLGVAAAFVGFYIAIVYTGVVLGNLGAGAMVRRYGPIRVSQGCLAMQAIGLSLCCFGTLPAIVAGAAILGLGYGPVTPSSSHLLALSTPAHRLSLMFSIKQTGVPLGGILAGAIAPGLCVLIGWRPAFGCIAAGCILFAVIAQPLRKRLDAGKEPDVVFRLAELIKPVRLVVDVEALRALTIFGFFFCAVQLSLTTYAVIYLTDELGFGLVAAGLVLSVCQLAGVVGRIGWGVVADGRLGPARTLALLATLISACCISMGLLRPTTPHAIVLGLLFLYGCTAIGWNGVFLAEISRKAPPGLTGLATGGSGVFTSIGVMVLPPIFAVVANQMGSFRIGFIALSVPMLWCAVRLMAMHERENR